MMRYLKIGLLLLTVIFGAQACILPVPVGGGWHLLLRHGW